MKALLYPRFDHLELADLGLPTAGSGEVILRVSACGLCGSELESFKTHSPRRQPPLVMGHEFCGVVHSTGPGVDEALTGSRVVSNALVPCGRCVRCTRGDTHLCAHRQIFGMHRGGAFAEFVVVPADVLLPWPEELSAEAACLAEPLGNGVHIVNLTRHLPAQTVLMIGAGPIGLMCQQAFQTMRGSSVMVADLSPGRLAVASRLGAVSTLCTQDQDLPTEARRWTEGDGVDIVVDAAGSATTKRLSISSLRPGGAAVWIGLHGDKMELDSYQVTLRERQILGTYAAKKEELATALELMRTGQVDVTSWIEAQPLDRAVEVFKRMLHPGDTDLKAVILP